MLNWKRVVFLLSKILYMKCELQLLLYDQEVEIVIHYYLYQEVITS